MTSSPVEPSNLGYETEPVLFIQREGGPVVQQYRPVAACWRVGLTPTYRWRR